MNIANVFVRRLNFNALKAFLKPYCNDKLRLINSRNKFTSFNFKHELTNDVVLYELHGTKHFKYINIISLTQCAFWTNMGLFLYNKVKSAKTGGEQEQVFWKKVLEKEKYAFILSLLAIIFGFSVLSLTSFYTMRSVTKLILNKGGKSVVLTTYRLPGFRKVEKIPISQVSTPIHRTKAKKFLPMKIKNHFFYYLIDIRGQFHHPELFDFTVGVNRNI